MFKRLLVFVLPVILIMGCCFVPAEKSFSKTGKQVTVYYFYGKPRCMTCKKIEQYTKEAVSEMNSDKVSYQAIDTDKPENKHYLKDYKLFTKSVIVSEKKNGKELKYKNLDKVWTLTNDEKKFKDYIKKEVNSSLGG